MWKFIVTWCITTWVPCPNSNQIDEFGRRSSISTLALCYHDDCDYSKCFFNRDEAFNFYLKAKGEMSDTSIIKRPDGSLDTVLNFAANNDDYFKGVITNVEIDSVKIK